MIERKKTVDNIYSTFDSNENEINHNYLKIYIYLNFISRQI